MKDSQGIGAGEVKTDTAIFIALIVMSTVAFYNVVELFFLILVTFKRFKGLYFWSLIVSSLGCFLHGLGFLLKFFQLTRWTNLSVTIITIGWYTMVTGQAVVLYSRLHLVELNGKIRRVVLYLIIIDAITFHIPTTVLTYGSNSDPNVASHFIPGYKIMEKIQMTAFCLQEFLLSGIYIRATWQRLPGFHDDGRKKILLHLFAVNVIIIFLDLALLSVEYANLYVIQVLLKSAVYSIKLKLEFSILGQLVDLVRPIGRERRLDVPNDRGRSFASAFPASPMTGTTAFTNDKYGRGRWNSVPDMNKTGEVELSWLEDSDAPHAPSKSPAGFSLNPPMSPKTQTTRTSGGSVDMWSKPHAI